MIFQINLSEKALKEISGYKKSGDLIGLKKIEKFIGEIKINPYSGTGKPERLKYKQGDVWSRRIDKKNRLIYEVFEDIIIVEIISAKGHYGEK